MMISAGNTELVVKQGPTSALLPLEILRHPANQVQPRYREHVAPVASGFHVSLRGTFGPSSHLAIAYAAFSYMGERETLALHLDGYFSKHVVSYSFARLFRRFGFSLP